MGGDGGSADLRKARRRRTRRALCFSLIFFSLPGFADPISPALQKEFDLAYQRLLDNPSDRALNRRLVNLALKLEDYDAAIGAVERLVFYEPKNAALQLEAAGLYFRIKSYAAARGYLDDALAIPGASAEVRKEATAMIAQIDDATRPRIWNGLVQYGLRYQTNANIGSKELGVNDPLPFEKPAADWNAFALASLSLNAPVGKRMAIEGSLSGYYGEQFSIHRLDLGFVEITGGPRFMSESGKFSFKPYGIAQGILLGSDPYQHALGGGAQAVFSLPKDRSLELQFEYKNRVYYNSDDYDSATNQNGDLFAYSAKLDKKVSDSLSFSSRVAYNQNNAVTGFNSYDQYVASVSARYEFELLGRPNWSVSPFAGISFTGYKGLLLPDNPDYYTEIRHDFQWNIGANFEIPLHERTMLGAQIQYTKNQSNLDRFTYDNLQMLFGPTGRF
jgi:hypothetical protein